MGVSTVTVGLVLTIECCGWRTYPRALDSHSEATFMGAGEAPLALGGGILLQPQRSRYLVVGKVGSGGDRMDK